MIRNWLTEDHRINLPKLFAHLGYTSISKESNHHTFEKGGAYYIVIRTEKGFMYYKVQRPQEKLSASDLVTEHVSKTEGENKETIWDKVDSLYTEVLEEKALLIDDRSKGPMEIVTKDFNHFSTYGLTVQQSADPLYSDLEELDAFSGRVFQNKDGEMLFPLFNLQNEVCGYFADRDKGILPYRESAIKHSLWYSNIPKKIEGLFLFKDPKEALAFHRKFGLKNVVYMALGEINSRTTEILFQIKRLVKVNKLFLSFTGNRKLEGYLRDLHFISYINGSDFKLSLTDRDMLLNFPMGAEKAFSRFYDHTRRFNKELAESFLAYNKIIDQNRLNRYSISITKDKGRIQVRLPLETNAIKLLVWSYYKNYLDSTIEILKPTTGNWYSEWKLTEGRPSKRKEVQWKEYRIAN